MEPVFPRSPMRWEWDQDGDTRVSDLWILRERLSRSDQLVYAKWYQGRATLISFELFPALLRLMNPDGPEGHLTRTAQSIYETLEEDSPLSTKALKQRVELVGRSNEGHYTRAMKELWQRLLIVGYREVDEGAFPSLAMGATRLIFEDLWQSAWSLSHEQAKKIILGRLDAGSLFLKPLKGKL